MTQTPITVTYSLEEVLVRIERKIDERFDAVDKRFDEVDKRFEAVDKRFEAFDKKFEAVNQKLEGIQIEQVNIKGNIKALEEKLIGDIKALDVKVDGLAKRIDNQEFVSRGVLIGLIVAIAGGAAKLFGFMGNP